VKEGEMDSSQRMHDGDKKCYRILVEKTGRGETV
jgi:hypothetical protein